MVDVERGFNQSLTFLSCSKYSTRELDETVWDKLWCAASTVSATCEDVTHKITRKTLTGLGRAVATCEDVTNKMTKKTLTPQLGRAVAVLATILRDTVYYQLEIIIFRTALEKGV